MAEINLIAPPRTTIIKVAVKQVETIFASMMLLSDTEDYTGLGEWLYETARKLAPEQRAFNKMVFGPLHAAAMTWNDRTWPAFADYLDYIADDDPVAMRDRVLEHIDETCYGCRQLGITPPDRETLLNDREAFIDVQRELYRLKGKGGQLDRAAYEAAHALLGDPVVLKARLVLHMRTMWKDHLAEEWERNLPLLEESAAAFQRLDFMNIGADEAFQVITGRPVPETWREEFDKAKAKASEMTFTPSAHIGPYLTMATKGKQLFFVFGARIPAGTAAPSSALNRSELLARLSALADDTRLRILELVATEGEYCAKDIITRLDLSQSAASRHLRQLVATGYLLERRREGAKCYRLNDERVDDILSALAALFQ